MTNKIKVLLLLLTWIIFLGLSAFAEDPIKTEKYFDPKLGKTIEVVAGEILVKFISGVRPQTINALNAEKNVKIIKRLPTLGVSVLSSEDPGVTVEELLKAYQTEDAKKYVEYAEPNYICSAHFTSPNDPNLSKQWGLSNIKALQAWDVQQGSNTVIIAVVDSGIDLNHPDLKNRMMAGYDYIDNDNDPSDAYGHGTHVAGILGAQTNNLVGIAGVNWDCRIMPVRVLGSDGTGTADKFALGVKYAADNGAKVINMSLGLNNGAFSTPLNDEIQAAYNTHGCIIVASAGNENNNIIMYPAGCDNVISVAALDQNDNRADYSNYNSKVDVSAPGGLGTGGSLHSLTRIYSTMPTYEVYMTTVRGFSKDYDTMHGTSMAAPFVSGFAGLLFAHNPTWTNASVEAKILASVDHLGTGAAGTRNDYYGYGRINMYKAFSTTPPTPPTAPVATQSRNQVVVAWTASTNTNVEKYYIYRSTSATGTFTLVGSTAATSLTYTDTITAAGTYYYKVSAVDAAGLESSQTTAASVTVVFTIDTITIYPNPFVIRTGSTLTFDGLNGTETIRLYTISGEQVIAVTISGATSWNWNGRNTGNKQVARGVYLYLITRPTGEKRVGKFAVIG